MKIKISITLIIVGIATIFFPKLKDVYFFKKSNAILNDWEKQVNCIEKDKNGMDLYKYKKNNKEKLYLSENVEGILKIDKINLKLPILKGDTKENLDISVASVKGKIGQGNYAIAGHRSRYYGMLFNRLDELEKGDKIEVYDGEKNYIYHVNDKFIVHANENWIFEDKNNEYKEIKNKYKGKNNKLNIEEDQDNKENNKKQLKEESITLITCDYRVKNTRLIIKAK